MTIVPGDLYIISAPSGAGKTSLVNALLEHEENLTLSISYTTRPPRPNEENGKSYHFIDKTTYDRMTSENDFLENAQVFDHLYGTSKTWVMQKLQQGVDVILEIDWQGANKIKKVMPNAIGIFILPPTLDALKSRLNHRQQDSAEVIERRLSMAQADIQHYIDFDYLIVNTEFDQAVNDLRSIFASKRLICAKQQLSQQFLLEKLLKKG